MDPNSLASLLHRPLGGTLVSNIDFAPNPNLIKWKSGSDEFIQTPGGGRLQSEGFPNAAGASHGLHGQGMHGTWSVPRQSHALSGPGAIPVTQSAPPVSCIVDPSGEDYSSYCTTDGAGRRITGRKSVTFHSDSTVQTRKPDPNQGHSRSRSRSADSADGPLETPRRTNLKNVQSNFCSVKANLKR